MDLSAVLEKQKRYEAEKRTFPEVTIESYEKAFEIEFTHNSTAIEGNTLTLMETKAVLEEKQLDKYLAHAQELVETPPVQSM